MADQEDLEKVRESGDKAKDYFSKVAGFEPKTFEKPAEEAPQEEEAYKPPVREKPEAPLSDAEKYFKKLI